MGVLKLIIFPARFAVVLCGRWFSFDPWTSIVFLTLYAGVLNLFMFFPLIELIADLLIIMQLSAVVGPTVFKIILLVVISLILLIWLLNVGTMFGAIFVFFIGACSAKPPEQSEGYKFYQRFIRTMVGGEN